MHAVEDLASKMTGWLDLDERLRVSGRVGLADTAAGRFGWESVAENVVNAARGRTAVLEPVPGEVPFSEAGQRHLSCRARHFAGALTAPFTRAPCLLILHQ